MDQVEHHCVIKREKRPAIKLTPHSKKCAICGSGRVRAFKAEAFDAAPPSFVSIQECENCTFAWQYPLGRSKEESVQFFKSAYADRGRSQSDYFNLQRKRKIAELEFTFVSSIPVAGNSLLEIGAGAGIFAEIAADNGWQVTAVDPALDIARMKNSTRLKKIQGTTEQIPHDELFDIVTLWDVIEHTSNPIALITKAKQHLKAGGWLVIETGNYKSADRLLGGLNHWMYQLDHRWYFSPESLQQVLTENGFNEFIFSNKVLRPDWNGNPVYAGPSRDDLRNAIARAPQHLSAHLSQYSYLTRARGWKLSGIGIFAMATRKSEKQ